jgi:hypothetical protein
MAHGQQTPATSKPPADSKDATPAADVMKKARDAGLKPEVRNGVTLFCWNDADMGSRIPSKKCVNEAQLQIMLDRRQAQRDQMQQVATAGVKSN